MGEGLEHGYRETQCPSPCNLMKVETPYPKRRLFTNEIKLTILLALWVLDKIIMAILIWLL